MPALRSIGFITSALDDELSIKKKKKPQFLNLNVKSDCKLSFCAKQGKFGKGLLELVYDKSVLKCFIYKGIKRKILNLYVNITFLGL